MQDRTRGSAEIARAPRPAIDLRIEPLTAQPAPARAASSRHKIWEIQGGLQCSIVGTCLSQEDLLGVGRKASVRPREGARAHEVHSYFVQQVGKDGKIARTVQKLLDQRHAGIIRRVQAAREEAELTRLWEEEFEGGRVAGAYWAFLSAAHVPNSLGTRIFGDVHMLSHVLGRVKHENASRASDLQARLDDLDAKLLRQAERHRQTVLELDAALMRLSDAMAAPVPKITTAGPLEGRREPSPGSCRDARRRRRSRWRSRTRRRARPWGRRRR
jgi:hypothetical protein